MSGETTQATLERELAALAAERDVNWERYIARPYWETEQAVNWEWHVPEPIRLAWSRLSRETQLVTFIFASEAARESGEALERSEWY